MTKQLSLTDFRAVRVVLEPDDFALGSDQPDPPPSDLASEETWRDDLQASFFDSLHGYYRTAFSALRNVIELMTIGACRAITRTSRYEDWRNGLTEFSFGTACDLLSTSPSLVTFNEAMRAAGHQSLWDAKKDHCRADTPDACTEKCVTLLILDPALPTQIFGQATAQSTSPRSSGIGIVHSSKRLPYPLY